MRDSVLLLCPFPFCLFPPAMSFCPRSQPLYVTSVLYPMSSNSGCVQFKSPSLWGCVWSKSSVRPAPFTGLGSLVELSQIALGVSTHDPTSLSRQALVSCRATSHGAPCLSELMIGIATAKEYNEQQLEVTLVVCSPPLNSVHILQVAPLKPH